MGAATSTAVAFSSPSDKPITTEPNPTIDPPNTLETENPNQETTDPSLTTTETANKETEEESECGFCLFMKGGECRETFINWDKYCVEEGEENNEDIVNKCFDATSALMKCMAAHPDYYGVILQAEKDVEQEVSKQLEKETVAGDSDSLEHKQKQGQE